MKKVLSMLMAVVMLLSITAGVDFSVYAGGWLDRVKKVKFDTTYDEFCDPTDYYDGRYHDSFEFNVPLSGTVNLYIESENESFFEYGPYNSCFYIYDSNNTTDYLYKFVCLTAYAYDSSRGVYFLNESITLPKGKYYFVTSCLHYDYNGMYSFILNYAPKISSPSNFRISSRGTKSLKLAWNKVSGVSGYQLQRKSGDSYKTVANTKSTSYTVSKLSAGTSYAFRVRAYKTIDGRKYYSSWRTLTTPTKPLTPSIKTPSTNKKHQIIVKWNRVSKCTGYQVQFSRKKNFSSVIATKTVSGSSKTSYTGKNFTKGKTYYVRVRAYKTVNGTKYCGAWSKVKSIKCR